MNTQTNTNPSRGVVQHNYPRTIQHGKTGQQQWVSQSKQGTSKQEGKARDFGGFDNLLVDRKCKIKTGTGEVIEGLITAASKYFYLMNVDGQVVVVNKAWVVSITPVQSPTNNQQNNNPVGMVSGNDKGEVSRQE
jgi:hypothetical protein